MQHPFFAALRHLGAAFVLGGTSTLLMRAVQRNASLGFRALDEWRARNVHVPRPAALPSTAQLFTLF